MIVQTKFNLNAHYITIIALIMLNTLENQFLNSYRAFSIENIDLKTQNWATIYMIDYEIGLPEMTGFHFQCNITMNIWDLQVYHDCFLAVHFSFIDE